jgi:hypothetical protein
MATKESGNVTVTLARTTVAMLRAKKKDLETWDDLMRRLYARQRKYGIECTLCGKFIEARMYTLWEIHRGQEYGYIS